MIIYTMKIYSYSQWYVHDFLLYGCVEDRTSFCSELVNITEATVWFCSLDDCITTFERGGA